MLLLPYLVDSAQVNPFPPVTAHRGDQYIDTIKHPASGFDRDLDHQTVHVYDPSQGALGFEAGLLDHKH